MFEASGEKVRIGRENRARLFNGLMPRIEKERRRLRGLWGAAPYHISRLAQREPDDCNCFQSWFVNLTKWRRLCIAMRLLRCVAPMDQLCPWQNICVKI